MSEPASWLTVERGWKVEGPDGAELGKVEETVGDSNRDIFNGLTVASGFFSRARYVPAERVTEIRDGLVRVSGIDPKGMELAYGRRIFSRYAVTSKDALAVLDDLAESMRGPQADLRRPRPRRPDQPRAPVGTAGVRHCSQFGGQ